MTKRQHSIRLLLLIAAAVVWLIGGVFASCRIAALENLDIGLRQLFVLVMALVVSAGGLVFYWLLAAEFDFTRRGYRIEPVAPRSRFRWKLGQSQWNYHEFAPGGEVRTLRFVRVVLEVGYPSKSDVLFPDERDWSAFVPPWAHERRSEILERVVDLAGPAVTRVAPPLPMDRARRTQQSYDRIAGEYLERNRDRSVLSAWMRAFAALIPAGAWVVDLGSGPGLDAAELERLGLRVACVDCSHRMLTLARKRASGPCIRADLRHLPFRPESLAGVWASASLLHLERADFAPALAGIAALLAPRGALFISLKDGAAERWENSSYDADAPRWFTYWSADEIDAALAKAGFEVLQAVTQAGSKEVWHIRCARRVRAAW